MAQTPPFEKALSLRRTRFSSTHRSFAICLLHNMDIDKCVVLQNKILEHGWMHSGKSREDLERNRKTWFDYHGDEAEAVLDILSPDTIAFLERAYEVDCEDGHAFFYHMAGLFSASLVQELSETFNHDYSGNNMLENIVLSNMNSSFGSHPVGLGVSLPCMGQALDDHWAEPGQV